MYPNSRRIPHQSVSDDLIHWRDLPYAIYPNPEDKCYSGTTLVEADRVIAMYHGVAAGTMVANRLLSRIWSRWFSRLSR